MSWSSSFRILVVGAHWDTVDKTGGLDDNGYEPHCIIINAVIIIVVFKILIIVLKLVFFRFDLLEKYGCSPELASRLNYAYDKVFKPKLC